MFDLREEDGDADIRKIYADRKDLFSHPAVAFPIFLQSTSAILFCRVQE